MKSFPRLKASRTIRRTSLAATLTLLTAGSIVPRAHAQSESGQVVGTVRDTAGAVIPDATLTLTNAENGLVLTSRSSDSGELRIPAVPRGNYTAKIEAAGFQSQTEPVTVEVTTTQTVVFQLSPGTVSTSVEVTGAASLVDTANPTLGETIEGKQITQLPLNGRNALNLALLTPGVTQGAQTEYGQDTVGRNGDTGGGVLSVNGTRTQANNFILDGVDNNDGLQNIVVFFPPVDATQEFKLDTNIAPAQYGRAGGALVISSLRSGSNQIHGSAFEFNRSNQWAANNNYQFQGAPFTPKGAFNRNQFGGSVGAPLIKNKIFLFGDYQGTRARNPFSSHYDTVPTALMRQGNFTELLNPALTGGSFITSFPLYVPNQAAMNQNLPAFSKGQIYDPLTQQPFPGNIIPAGRLNPVALNYFNAFPLPTRTDRVLNNYATNNYGLLAYNTFDARLDWNPGSTNLFFLRFSYDNSTSGQTSELAQNGPNEPQLSANGQANFFHARGYDLGYTHTFSPQIVNEARLAYNRVNYAFAPSNVGTDVGRALGFANAGETVPNQGGPLIGGGSELTYTGDYGLFATPQNTYEGTDTLTINRGPHSLSVGGTYLFRQVEFFRPLFGKGGFFDDGDGSEYTGYTESEFEAGGLDNYQIGAQLGYFGNNSQEDAAFAQDDWRVNDRLTLNLGIRYDLLTWPSEIQGRQSSIDIATGTFLLAGRNGVPSSIRNQDYLNFAPRVGFAYDLHGDGKSAIHGGYGIFYFPDYGGISNQLGQNPPFGGSTALYAYTGHCITLSGQTATPGAPFSCAGYTSPAAVTAPLQQPGFLNFSPAAPPASIGGVAVNQNDKHSRLQEWNLQLQQQFTSKDVLSIAYVGTHGDRLSTYYNDYNDYTIGGTTKPLPNLGGVVYNTYDGFSNYQGLQTHYEHRGTNFLATASYAWSHALDNSDTAFGGIPITILLAYDQKANYGNSNFDVRQISSGSFVWNLPFGRGQQFGANASRLLDLAIGGWQLNDIVLLSTGTPVDLSAAGSAAPGNRPDLVAPITYPKSISGTWFNTGSFSSTNIPTVLATDGTGRSVYTRVGTLARDQVYGPGNRVMNLGVQKNLHISEGRELELHGDAFNVFNTPNFANPNNGQGTPSTFGVITGLHGPVRQLQLAARLAF